MGYRLFLNSLLGFSSGTSVQGFTVWAFLVQVLHGVLDPLLLRISTDFLAQFGLEAVRERGLS
jgi:hypothetical protein